jgi:hypothetical protein
MTIQIKRAEREKKRQELETARKSGDADQIKTAETKYSVGLLAHNTLKKSENEKSPTPTL